MQHLGFGLGLDGGHNRAVQGTRHMIAAGHHAATLAGYAILEGGGNAVDAGVAAGIALGVVHSDIVNVAGVAPILLYLPERDEVVTISGLGGWPKATRPELFETEYGGRIPEGILRTVVPAAPAAWILALERYGTMSFGEVAAAAIRLARDGFPMHSMLANHIAQNRDAYARWPSNAAVYLPGGRPPRTGELFVQADLGASLQYMADQERAAASGGRIAGLRASRDAFYRGEIAEKIVRYHRENGGWLAAEDLESFEAAVEPPVRSSFAGADLYTCGAWCQGPMLAQLLQLLDRDHLARLGHNSPAYIHWLAEAVKLTFADRERWIGDPRFVDVPLDGLLSRDYAALRRALIQPDRAALAMPRPGDPRAMLPEIAPGPSGATDGPDLPIARDTSYVCAVDRHGNVFSATPSDVSRETVVIPGTGLCPSSRGSQSFAVRDHPSAPAPGKRPRLTPNPAMVRIGNTFMPFGTPGGDVQTQAMAQVLLNLVVFGMDLQSAIDAPRFASYSFPSSFEPHDDHPGLLKLERLIPDATAEALRGLGHRVEMWPEQTWLAGGVCAVVANRDRGLLLGAADPRRHGSAAGS